MSPIDESHPEAELNSTSDHSIDHSSTAAPPVHLLLEWEPWHKAFLHRISESIHPPKLPPLIVTSQPIPVPVLMKELQQYRRNRLATPVSLFFHLIVIAAVLQLGRRAVQVARQPIVTPHERIFYSVTPYDNGGGGGGDRSNDPPSKGNLPKPSLVQIAPPTVIIRNPAPKLAVEPTIIAPPNIQLPQTADMLQLGDLWSNGIIPSNGPGQYSGIGDGEGSGVGPGKGPGAGPGEGGCCSGLFHVGKDVTAPQVIFQVEPEYSDQARKAKYQGMVELYVVIQKDGTVRDVRLKTPLGMGLDEKAIEAVKQWRFRPSTKGGQPVDVSAVVEVIFRLL